MNFKAPAAPFSERAAYILIILLAGGYLIILAKSILSPLLFSFLFSILLLPLAGFMERKCRLGRGIASVISVLLLIAGISLVFYLVGSQISNLAKDWPQFQKQLVHSLHDFQTWIESKYQVDADEQMSYMQDATSDIMGTGTAVFGATMLSLSSILLFLVFVFIYTIFFLLYRSHILRFLVSVFKEENSSVVYDIVEQIQFIIRKYVIGLFLEMLIVAGVCCISFLALGINYAVLLGLITGLFNIIPYVGIFSALLISLLITFATTGALTKVLLVLIVIVVMHLIDSNILLPVIVGSKVKINAFITVIGVVLGEMFWGIPGMFLSIPIIAVFKIIFDRIESLKPWGLLLGDEERDKKPMTKKQVLESTVKARS